MIDGALCHLRTIMSFVSHHAPPQNPHTQDLLLEDYDSDTLWNNQIKHFHKDKKAEKVWKSVKL